MRESFGGAFMIRLVLVFIVIYISFMAVAVNYAKAFRVKNQLINIVEHNQYKVGDNDTIRKIDDYLKSVSYLVNDNNEIKECKNSNGTWTNQGACIVPVCINNKCHYIVTTYLLIEFPFFGIKLTLPIHGETETIVY